MFELFRVLIKNSGFILFVIFECIAFYLIINFNRPQREIFLYSSNVLSATILNQYNKISDYFELEKINDRLTDENARLYAQLNQAGQRGEGRDSLDIAKTSFKFVGGRVISNSVNQRNNYFLIDKGRNDGVQTGMGVISDNMPVGIVHRVTGGYADVLSFLNSDFNISSKISGSAYFGTVHWNSSDPKKAELRFIPKHANIEIGDTVLTSGYSTIFPSDLPIGVIEQIMLPSGSNFFDLQIDIIPDLGRLEYVQIIENMNKMELDSLKRQ